MSRDQQRDPEKRRIKRAARREAYKRIGDEALPNKGLGKGAVAQMDHASSGKAVKKRNEGQAKMESARPDLATGT